MIFAASVVLSAALLLAMVLNLTLSPASSKKITTGSMIIALIGGLIFYGIGITQTEGGSLLLSVIRTPMCVLRRSLCDQWFHVDRHESRTECLLVRPSVRVLFHGEHSDVHTG